ncbi:tol-pal system YbgF family protein [Geodermatophilus sp. SYSU D00703]
MRQALRGLDPRNATRVAEHLVAAGTLVDDDPDVALAHARAARDRASRIAAVREAVGVAAYHAGDYAEAARELRAYRRMSGDEGYRAVLADCERALGRPEVALRLVREALDARPDADEVVELRLVEAGARQDLGELPAARLVLEDALGGRPRPESVDLSDPGALRLAGAYADLLAAAGEDAPAQAWTAAVAAHSPVEVDVEFSEEELPAEDLSAGEAAAAEDVAAPGAPAESFPEPVPATDDEQELVLDEDIEAEVAELLGEIEPPEDPGEH